MHTTSASPTPGHEKTHARNPPDVGGGSPQVIGCLAGMPRIFRKILEHLPIPPRRTFSGMLSGLACFLACGLLSSTGCLPTTPGLVSTMSGFTSAMPGLTPTPLGH